MNVNALAVRLVVDPVSLINVAVDMGEFTEAMRPIVFPVALIAGPIAPDLLTASIAESADPLTGVLCASRVLVRGPYFALRIRVVRRVRYCFLELDGSEVTTICALRLLQSLDLHACCVTAPQGLQTDDCPKVRPEGR